MFKFTYVKDEHEVTERELIVLKHPVSSYFGIDLSTREDITITEKEYIEEQIQLLLDKQSAEFSQLVFQLGLQSAYRSFKPEKMVVEKK
jgi:hypothetical protein